MSAPTTSPPAPKAVRTTTWACSVCGADAPRPYRMEMYTIGSTRFHLVRCRDCGLVYVNPRPDEATLSAMYDDESYYTTGYNLGVEDQNYFERKDELIALAGIAWERIEKETAGQGRVMELGSAGGFFLEAARRRGWQVAGVELSPPAARYCKQTFEFEVFEGWLEDAPYETKSFDLTIADNVLEHTLDPRGTLRQLRSLTKPGGHVLVIVPTYVNSGFFRLLNLAQFILPRKLLGTKLCAMLKFDDSDRGYPYHILEFNRANLVDLAKSAGLEILSVEGSLPRPAHLFKVKDLSPINRIWKGIFITLDHLMGLRLAPAARIRLLARRPAHSTK